MVHDLFKGIEDLHSRQYVYKDLKAENILVFFDEGKLHLKFCDLGSIEDYNNDFRRHLFFSTSQMDLCNLGYILFEFLYRQRFPHDQIQAVREEVKKYPLLDKLLSCMDSPEKYISIQEAMDLLMEGKSFLVHQSNTPRP